MTKEAFQYALKQMPAPKGRALWLYGEPGIASGDVYHPWAGPAEALKQSGCKVFSELANVGHDYDAVYVNAPRQREEAEGLLALALERSKDFVMAAAANDAGGGRLEGLLEAFGVKTQQTSKDKCRVVWTMDAAKADRARIKESVKLLQLQQVNLDGEQWWSAPGLFAWNKIDPGSTLLLKHLPSDIAGKIADFGCGYGYLSTMLLRHNPAISAIDAYDADARAIACARRNAEVKLRGFWQDVRDVQPERQYDAAIMNPPFHNGKDEDFTLGQTFIRKAWESLKPGGRLFFVANRNLPYEKVVPALTILVAEQGYKVLTGRAA